MHAPGTQPTFECVICEDQRLVLVTALNAYLATLPRDHADFEEGSLLHDMLKDGLEPVRPGGGPLNGLCW